MILDHAENFGKFLKFLPKQFFYLLKKEAKTLFLPLSKKYMNFPWQNCINFIYFTF